MSSLIQQPIILDLFDWGPPKGKTKTSAAAAKKVELTAKAKRAKVYRALVMAGEKGLIAYECWQNDFPNGTLEQSIRPRFTELVSRGLAIKTDEVRQNGRGNDETVYRIPR